MVPKQTVQIQEDHEERALWTRGRPPRPPAAVLLLSLLPVGHQHGRQRRAGALWGIHEQFCSLVPGTPAGLHAENSDDVTSQEDATLPGQMMDLYQQDGAVRDTDIVASLSHSGGKNNVTGRSIKQIVIDVAFL